MTTIRVAKRKRFTTIDRGLINDDRLTLRARGLLVWLLDKPDDWLVTSQSIVNQMKEGRDAIRTALEELEACGYLRREKGRDSQGQWQTVTTVYECPTTVPENPHRSDSPQAVDEPVDNISSDGDRDGKPGPGSPAPDSQALKEERLIPNTDTEKPPPPPQGGATGSEWVTCDFHPGVHEAQGNCTNQAALPADYGFDRWWKTYPARDGQRGDKRRSLDLWRRFKYPEKREAWRQLQVYVEVVERGRPAMDAQRWLRRIRDQRFDPAEGWVLDPHHTPVTSPDRKLSHQEAKEAANADTIRRASEAWEARRASG